MPTGAEIVDRARAMIKYGVDYVYGAEADLDDPHPAELDCSELVETICHQAKVRPFMPDGAVFQFRHCVNHDLDCSLEKAYKTPGALLFWFSADPLEVRPRGAHVAISDGQGRTWECRSSDFGCGSWSAHRSFNYAALIPGVDYNKGT